MLQSTSRRVGAGRLANALAAVFMFLIGHVSSARVHASTRHVREGQSIQNVIDAASPGDRIFVDAGTYAEQLTIKTDGIALIGIDTVLIPPAIPTQNLCTGLAGDNTQAGICVTGSNVELAPFQYDHREVVSVGRPVEDVSITGFQIRGFSGENLALIGTRNARVTGNKLLDGQKYGFLTAGSGNTLATGNVVTSSTGLLFIGMCLDDLVNTTKISNNKISGYWIGLCVQTAGADVRKNKVKDCCVGAYIDAGINGAKISQNYVSSLNTGCPKEGPTSGIYIDGAINTLIEHNIVEGQTNGDSATGISIVDHTIPPPPVPPVVLASGNVIRRNILRNNDIDLFVNATGPGNVIVQNQCSTPTELCKVA